MGKLYGHICLSDIPKELIREVKMRDGSVKKYLNISIGQRQQVVTRGNREVTHYVSCAPSRDKQREGVNYFIGDLGEWVGTGYKQESPVVSSPVSPASPVDGGHVSASASAIDDLPF